MLFNNKYETLFLDTNSPVREKDNKKVNIILSPSLYWVKKLTLLVKYARDVKKLLPSIFEDILPEGNYNYSAYKNPNLEAEESEFFVFAYEDKKILNLLSEKNISISNVASIRFAQSEMDSLDGAYNVSENKVVYVKDSIVVMVPKVWVKESENLDLSFLTPSKHKITLQQFGHIVDNKSLYKIASVLVVLILLIIAEIFVTSTNTTSILENKDELFVKNKLKSTKFQNISMLKKYKTLHKKQTKLRKYIRTFLSIKLQKNEKLSLVSLKNNLLTISFSGIKRSQKAPLETQINKVIDKKVKMKKSYKNEIFHLELSL